MLDFMSIDTRFTRNGIEIRPKFRIARSKDLMIKGNDFYAIWDEENLRWETSEERAVILIDNELSKFAKEKGYEGAHIWYLWDASNGMIDSFHKYCQKQRRDEFVPLDERLVFLDTKPSKELYSSKHLNYSLCDGDRSGYETLISTLYSPEERHKLEWCIGSILSGDSRFIQKFAVLYGAHGTGKSTMLNIVQRLFEGYYCVFDAQALGNRSNSFALESFSSNPLVGIQHDGDLSKIEDNTRINSLVSHEYMTVNEKYKHQYGMRFHAFLFMGTNKPVKITDAKSGLIRRLIDISPSGNKVSANVYKKCMSKIEFELGAIAKHCLNVYMDDPKAYDNYVPINMIGATNDFFNFIEDSFDYFSSVPYITLRSAWDKYKAYSEDAKLPYPLTMRVFKEELKNYFNNFEERDVIEGMRVRNVYKGFNADKFDSNDIPTDNTNDTKQLDSWLIFDYQPSILDKVCAECPAQYANDSGTPSKAWDSVTTKLKDLDTSVLHYLKDDVNGISHIIVDFDLVDESGNKSLERNLAEASKWPKTYAELSKSGEGIHLHYIYSGDPEKLKSLYSEKIEIKVYKGKSSIRRKLTKCNNLDIATISSGLPEKETKKTMVSNYQIKSEKKLREFVEANLRKEKTGFTATSISLINKALDDAYEGGLTYDLTDMKNDLIAFALGSTHQANKCLSIVSSMKLKSAELPVSVSTGTGEDNFYFFDIEIFPNLMLVCYKKKGIDNEIIDLINPDIMALEKLMGLDIVGFNCKRYDNHIVYGRYLGQSIHECYNQSKAIIDAKKGTRSSGFFGAAYNMSKTDIYDFASAGNKKSLKALEIEMGCHHQELNLDWNKPIDMEKDLPLIIKYCHYDVQATEAAFDYLKSDWIARKILAGMANGDTNDSTNSLTTKFIFGNNKSPQGEFMYRDLSKPVHYLPNDVMDFLKRVCPDMMATTHGDEKSLLPYFPDYKFENGVSTYRGSKVGEGGCVRALPGIWVWTYLLDITSQHPHSVIAECLFGPRYTQAFYDIVYCRVHIKHEEWDIVNQMLGGILTPYVDMVKRGEISSSDLANALKTAINSVYGLTAASFENAFRDPRNVDNIVAKRGALFMLDLKHQVEKLGYTVAHIKTDSIKIPEADEDIVKEVMAMGKRYGYNFELEAIYERMCLVNDAVYIAKYADNPVNGKKAGKWTATGAQFQVPYVFKTLFSKEPLEFEDFCETRSVKTSLFLDMNEDLGEDLELIKNIEKLETMIKKLVKNNASDDEIAKFTDELNVLKEQESKYHDYVFVGKVGSFVPVKPGYGGGRLVRTQDNKYHNVSGSSGFRWLESEYVKEHDLQDAIDLTYFEKLAEGAINEINKHGDFDLFVNGTTEEVSNEWSIPF